MRRTLRKKTEKGRFLSKSFFRLTLFVIALTLISCGGLSVYLSNAQSQRQPPTTLLMTVDPRDLPDPNLPYQQAEDYFENLAIEKGGVYAFEVLKKATLPPNTDFHLLGHVVGDVLYKQKGGDGIAFCSEDFRNACSHSIVIGLLSDKGVAALSEINLACQKAPGGKGAYGMCFHGLGHGVLAFAGYDFPQMVKLCDKTSSGLRGAEEKSQCIGGAVMEIISGGFHDREAWGKKRTQTLRLDDPLSPCNKDYIPEDSKHMCYTYITPWLFEAASLSAANPQSSNSSAATRTVSLSAPSPMSEEIYEKAFSYCQSIPAVQTGNRAACFGGFGKEFIGLANERDIRDMGSLPKEKLKMVYDWCQLPNDEEGAKHCLLSAMSSLYWGGENKPDAAITICDISGKFREGCFDTLINSVSYFASDKQKTEFCGLVPEDIKGKCGGSLNILTESKL